MKLENNPENKITEWLDNIIGIPAKEIGLLCSDSVQRWRIKNQLTTLAKAIEKAKQLNLPLKLISPKLLCPLLENCSLEYDDFMQDKWANMLVNMLDSEQNIQNHVLPFILSQMGKSEFQELEFCYLLAMQQVQLIDNIRRDIAEKNKISAKTLDELNIDDYMKIFNLKEEYAKLFAQRYSLTVIRFGSLGECEKTNLLRLGLIRSIPIVEKQNNMYSEFDFQGNEYSISELGESFMKACLPNKPISDLLMDHCIRLKKAMEEVKQNI